MVWVQGLDVRVALGYWFVWGLKLDYWAIVVLSTNLGGP